MTSARNPVALPIHAIRSAFDAALAGGPVVVSSPTGSGKSTEVPRWAASRGRVLVVEPRRIACRSLAARVAELEGTRLGDAVGYVVRDESAVSEKTRILFATPGIVLSDPGFASGFDVLVLDELHERSLELDLLLALFTRKTEGPRLVVMSATLESERLATHLGAARLEAEGRLHPVAIHHVEADAELPDGANLAARIGRALARAANDPGDVLVFLPGKAEIDACERELRGSAFDVIPLHGALSLAEQKRAFAPSSRRKLVLATNVAETSITLPGVGVVIDSGLVRRTRYHEGRAFLALAPIADDSATQRAGRAGRLGPGVCYRLWGRSARLERITPPSIHRESLVPLLLDAAAWNRPLASLAFFDVPKPYALDAARDELVALGALDAEGAITPRGRELHGLPLDAPLARLLVEARGDEAFEDVVDLVSVLATGRPLFVRGSRERESDGGDHAREGECDASAMILALRSSDPRGCSEVALEEAHRIRARLRRAHALPPDSKRVSVDRAALVRVALRADPRCAHVARTRGRELAFSNGGTELELARESLVGRAKDLEAIVVFESRAFGAGRDARVLVTCATPTSCAALARAGLGRDRLEGVTRENGRIVARIERVYAKRVLATREETPTGELAREAIATLFLRGSVFKEALAKTKERLGLAALAAKLGFAEELAPSTLANPAIEAWVAARLLELGIESGDDFALLSPGDLTAPDVPFHVRSVLERDYPRTVSVGDATYEAEYDLEASRVTLRLIRGTRKDPPPLSYLPRFAGLGIVVTSARGTTVLRARG